MTPRFLDTNILLRVLTRDDPEKARASLALLERVELGAEVVVCSDLVIAEAVFILESPRHYALTKSQIKDLLDPVVRMRGLRIPNKSLYPKALELFAEKNISFPDAYHAVYMESQGLAEIYSYDRDFNRITGITRIEPSPVP